MIGRPYVPTDPAKAEFLTELLIRELWNGRHQLMQDFWIYSAELAQETGGSGIYLVPLGTITNYISSPRIFWAIVPRDGPEKWASVGHDAASHGELIDVTGAPAYLTKQQTDNLFKELMAIPPCDQVPGWKRWLMYRFVKRWGTGTYRGRPKDAA